MFFNADNPTSLSNHRQSRAFEQRRKYSHKDPNEGLDYVSSVKYLQPPAMK